MKTLTRTAIIVLVAVAVLAMAAPAFAAPVAWQTIDVTLHPKQSGGTMLVSGDLPEGAVLPAEAQLSIPASSTLQWIGEILGGDPAADPELKYTKTTVAGADVYSFTLTKSRTAQIEYATADGHAFDGSTYTTALRWVATQGAADFHIGVQLPAGARVVQESADATTQVGPSGAILYGKELANVKPGDVVDLSFTYEVPAAAPLSPSSSPDGALPTILIVVAAAGAALLIYLAMRKVNTSEAAPVAEAAPQPSPKKAAAVAAAAKTEEFPTPLAEDGEDAEDAESGEAPAHTTGPRRARVIAMIAIIGALVVGAMWFGNAAGRPKMMGDTFVKTYSEKPPCVTANIPLRLSGADPATVAETVFKALGGVPGMAKATINVKTGVLEAGFCESSASEASIRSTLAPTGLVAD